MFETTLFLAFALSESFQVELLKLPASEKQRFIQEHPSPFLEYLEDGGVRYLGKLLGASIEMEALESMNAHVYSILKKMVPHFPYEACPLVIVAKS